MLRSRSKQPFGFARLVLYLLASEIARLAAARDASVFFHPSLPLLSAIFTDQSPRRTIVSDRRDIVTKLIRRRYNTGRRRFRLGAPHGKGLLRSTC